MSNMKKTALASLLLLALSYCLAPIPSASADVGSCYSPRPICVQGSVVCMCDVSLNCFWACR